MAGVNDVNGEEKGASLSPRRSFPLSPRAPVFSPLTDSDTPSLLRTSLDRSQHGEEDGSHETKEERDGDDARDPLQDLRRETAQLKAALTARVALRKAEEEAALRHERDLLLAQLAALDREEAVSTAARAATAIRMAAAVEQTPLRPAPQRTLSFLSTVGRKAPNAATLARQAAIERLPDYPVGSNAVNVTIAPRAANATVHVDHESQAAGGDKAGISANLSKTIGKPSKFSGDNAVQNERVASWVAEMNRFLRLSNVPSEMHLDVARGYITSDGSAQEWIVAREEEVAFLGKRLTWEWLQEQLIQHYAQPSGAAAMQAEWQALRMGIKSADGSDTGKSTRTVKSYTNRFLHYMRLLTSHTVQTSDVLVIDRYVAGIRTGYEALWRAMLGVQRVLTFATLQEAIEAAEVAEAEIAIGKINGHSSTPSSYVHSGGRREGEGAGRGGGVKSGGRATTESLNALQGETEGEEEGQEAAPARTQVYGFRYNPGPDDGRHRLTEKEQRMLYDEKRCYRCYGVHPVGVGKPACTKAVQKVAPKPLK